jgi:predicted RNase H-like nuclease (RuvC/YqgF family)|tara:strand:- start:1247 stop:1618 length:372 start_codon:yes stop_codon:yes gene_type:complete
MSERMVVDVVSQTRVELRTWYLAYTQEVKKVQHVHAAAYHKLENQLNEIEKELDKLDRFVERYSNMQQCENCGEWTMEQTCDQCHVKNVCNSCDGTGWHQLGPDEFSESMCRPCRGSGEHVNS